MELELKSIRVKVHSGDDTRYIMVAPLVVFEDFVDRVREKFGIRTRFKLKVRDEGDLITMGDRDDWEMTVQSVRKEAGKDGDEMGKMEVSYSISFETSHRSAFVLPFKVFADVFSSLFQQIWIQEVIL